MGLFVEGDIPYVANGNCNNGMFGNNGDWIWAFLLLALLGNGGWGFGGGNNGVGSNYVLATDFATIERKIDGVNQGLCDGFYAMNTGMLNGFSGVQQTLCQGFSGVNASITDVGYAIKDCCCQTQRAIDGVNYNMATNFGALNNTLCGLGRDIIDNQNANYRAILDYLTGEKIDTLNRKLTAAENEALTYKNNAYLISQIKEPCPIPAYITPNPNCCYNYGVTGFGYGNGCCTSVQ